MAEGCPLEYVLGHCNTHVIDHEHVNFKPKLLLFKSFELLFELRLNRVQVNGLSAGDVVVVQMKTRSKSGAFLPCEDLVRRWVVVFTGIFHVNGEQSGGVGRHVYAEAK